MRRLHHLFCAGDDITNFLGTPVPKCARFDLSIKIRLALEPRPKTPIVLRLYDMEDYPGLFFPPTKKPNG